MPARSPEKKIRYAVVGLGYFGQAAILPAFAHARQNSELAALVSSDPIKHRKLGRQYRISHVYSYDQYDECLRSGAIDAVYIALPNHLHKDFTIRAAQAGIHVLCEKPLAVSETECRSMIQACRKANVKLMTAYRLHFEAATLEMIEGVTKGKIGEPRFFSSVFSHQVSGSNIRAREETGGGGLWDLGVYCVNAARCLFRAEPESAFAMAANAEPERFTGVDETASAVLRFSGNRLAQFTTCQGAVDTDQFRIVGTRGEIIAEPAFEFAEGLAYQLTVNGKTQKRRFPKRDQIAPEILYFSDCILRDREPEPSGAEGLADVRVIQALYESARTGKAVRLGTFDRAQRPSSGQKITRPGVEMPELVHAASPGSR